MDQIGVSHLEEVRLNHPLVCLQVYFQTIRFADALLTLKLIEASDRIAFHKLIGHLDIFKVGSSTMALSMVSTQGDRSIPFRRTYWLISSSATALTMPVAIPCRRFSM